MIPKIKNNLRKQFFSILGKYNYHFKENYITDHIDISWWENHINNIVLNQYQSILRGVVADFGCNHGACTLLAARNSRIQRIIGFDLNKKAIRTASKLLKESSEKAKVKNKVKFIFSYLTDLNLPEDYFDSAFMFHVLEHIYPQDRKNVLSEIKRVMKNNSHFVVTVPFEDAYNDEYQHVAFFNEYSLKSILTKEGFDVLECYRDQRKDKHTPQGHDCLNAICKVVK